LIPVRLISAMVISPLKFRDPCFLPHRLEGTKK
jgi:hypothetical protein